MTFLWSEKKLQSYKKAHQDVLIFDQSAYSKIEVSGSDHIPFLHNILSQDIARMKVGEWREAALLSAVSHVLAYVYILRFNDRVILIGMPGTTLKVMSLLEKFIITEDVRIRDSEKDWKFFEMWGPCSAELAGRLSDTNFVLALSHENIPRLLVLAPALPKIFEKNISQEADIRETLRVESGVLEWGRDFNETFMLSETRLEKKSASETKGCYPGQEVVAKIETYGRLNRSFVRLYFSTGTYVQPDAGATILDSTGQEKIGVLTSRVYSPFFKKTIGLGWLKRGFFEKPIGVLIQSEELISAKTSEI